MKEQLIKFKTAKLAKEKGFKNKIGLGYKYNSGQYYTHKGQLNGDITPYLKEWFKVKKIDKEVRFEPPLISAVTQSLLQKWLREKHDIHIIMVSGYSGFPNYDVCVMLNKTNHLREDKDYSYEKALEKGLQEALKLIK